MRDGRGRRGGGAGWKAGLAAAGLLAGSVAVAQPAAAGARLSADELAAAADAACIESGEQLGVLFAELFPTGDELPPADEAAPVMAEAASVVEEYADAITSLKPPAGLQGEWLDIERLTRRLDTLIRRSARAAAKGDTDGYLNLLGEANAVDHDARPLFDTVGAGACSGG